MIQVPWLVRLRPRGASSRRRGGPRLLLWTALPALTAAGLAVALLADAGQPVTVTTEQRAVIGQLESVLLHDTVEPQYARAVYQFDSRGYVLGIGDFSTADGEAFEVVQAYTAEAGPNPLSRDYLSVLARLSSDRDPSIDDLAGLPEAWAQASQDVRFRQAQHDVLEARFFTPTLDLADQLGVRTPLGVAVLFDSLIQHGNTDHADSLPALVERTNARTGGLPGVVPEPQWLAAFLEERTATLTSPADSGQSETWLYSLGRVEALEALLDGGNDLLLPPLTVNPYGTPRLVDPAAATAPPGPDVAPRPTRSSPGPTPPEPSERPEPPRTTPEPPRPPSTTKAPRPTPTRAPTATAAPAERSTSPQHGLVVRLETVTSGKSAGVRGGSTADGAPIVLGDGTGTAQQWQLRESHTGCFHLINVRSGRALDNPEGLAFDGTQMHQWEYAWGNYNQAWCFRNVGGDRYTVQNLAAGTLLDVRDGGTANGTAVQQWGADPTQPNANQTWRLIRVR